MNDLTEYEMRDAINFRIIQVYPKLLKDAKQVSGYNFSKYGDDLLAYTLEKFLCDKTTKYQYQVVVIDDKLPNYIGRAMSLHIRSHTSPFWHRYRKEAYNSRGVYEAEYGDTKNGKPLDNQLDYVDDEFDTPSHFKDLHECMLWAINNIHFYYKQLMTDYYLNNLTYHQMHLKYNITLNSIKKDMIQGQKLIKELCQP
jgi:hypothetical protein